MAANPTNYCTVSDLTIRFGSNNLTMWSAIDGNNSDANNAIRQQAAVDWATAQINTLLVRGPYAIPLQFLDTYSQAVVNDWAIELAVWKLYEARGHNDEDKDYAKFEEMRRKTVNEIMRVRAGSNQINCARRWGDNPTCPTMV